MIVVRKEGAAGSHRDFQVRRSIVLHALQWLIAYNMYYRNVSINHDALALLPDDGDLCGLYTTMPMMYRQSQIASELWKGISSTAKKNGMMLLTTSAKTLNYTKR